MIRPFAWLVVASLSLSGCALAPLTLVAPKDGAQVVVSGIDVEIFSVGVDKGGAPVAQSKVGKDFYVPEQKIVERLPGKLDGAGIPARGKLVSTLPGDPVPTPDQVFGATPANELLVLTKLNSETNCMYGTCGTSTWYRVSLQDRDTHVERWATRFHLGSSDRSLDSNMRAMDVFLSQIVTELQKVVVVKS
jgi:hypothetical protein